MDQRQELIRTALNMRERSYVPYSGYAVGAALLTDEGKIYPGCNIENASFTPTVCAERTAFFRAVSEGERNFTAIAVAGGPKGKMPEGYAVPCGVCLQVMSEFCKGEFQILLVRSEEEVQERTLEELLPLRFDGLSEQTENK